MTIQIDTREKARAIKRIVSDFDALGVRHYSSKLFVGDYMNLDNPRVLIDRKQNLAELCANVSDVPKKDESGRFKRDSNGRIISERIRFIDELKRAKDAGLRLIILCEHGGGIKCLEDVAKWKNPRLAVSPLAVSGVRLHKILSAVSQNYGVSFEFCDKRNTAKHIISLLGK